MKSFLTTSHFGWQGKQAFSLVLTIATIAILSCASLSVNAYAVSRLPGSEFAHGLPSYAALKIDANPLMSHEIPRKILIARNRDDSGERGESKREERVSRREEHRADEADYPQRERHGHMTPEDRQQLRRDIRDAGRNIYPHHGHRKGGRGDDPVSAQTIEPARKRLDFRSN